MHLPLCLHFVFPLVTLFITPPLILAMLVILVVSTGVKVSRTCSCVSYFMTAASPHFLNLLSPFLVHILSWWCGACDFPFPVQSYLVLFHMCSGGCDRCHEFYPLGCVLLWSLVSCLWLGIPQIVMILCLISIKIWLSCHICSCHHFLLILGLVCLPLVALLPRLHHHHHHNPRHHCHPHCTHFHCWVTLKVLFWL